MPDLASLRVLIVEDDADTRENLCDLLALDGIRADTAATLAEGLAFESLAQVDAVLLDRRLPDGRAEDILPRLKERAPDAAVLIVTGHADLEGAIRALREGAEDYLLKPINPDLLRSSLQRVQKLRRAEQEIRMRAAQQETIARLGQIALRGISLPELFQSALQEVTTRLGAEYGCVLEALPEQQELKLLAEVGTRPAHLREPEMELSLAGGSAAGAGWAVIRGAKSPFGLLCVGSSEDRELGQSDISFLEAVAGVLASAIDRMQAEERALQAERLAAIGQVVAGLAHESRNALQRSLACLEMLALDLEDRPEALDLVHRTQRAQDHLHKLFEEVRGYAGPVRLEVGEFGVRDIWREAWTLLAKQREGRSIQLREQLRCAYLDLQVDQFRLVQVFRNLFENSLAACADPVEIVMTCEDAMLDGKPAVRIAVRDNGPGLNPEQARRVFDPFYTTKTHGTGLGMPIAQRLIEAHGGTLRLVPGGQGGAEFVITLPRPSKPPQDP